MEIKVSTDPKTVKMFRRLERFLDDEGLATGHSIDFQNAETGRVFATFVPTESYRELLEDNKYLVGALREAQALMFEAAEHIDFLEDGNALLDLIDLQNEVIQGRAIMDEAELSDDEGHGPGPFPIPGTNGQVEWVFTGNDVAGNAGTLISAQEYEELLNLRKKRERDHKALSSMDAKLKEYKKNINSLQSSRDTWHARADENYEMALRILNNTRRINGLAPLDLVPAPWSDGHIAFTADAIRSVR